MQTSFQQLTPSSVTDSGQSGQVIREGSVLHAVVSSANDDGSYILKAGNLKLAVHSDSPLKTGQQLSLLATRNPEGKLTLQVLPESSQLAASLQQTAQITKSLGIPVDSSQIDELGRAISRLQQEKEAEAQSEPTKENEESVKVNDKGLKTDMVGGKQQSPEPKSLSSTVTANSRTGRIELTLQSGETLKSPLTTIQLAQTNSINLESLDTIISQSSPYTLNCVNITLQGTVAEEGPVQLPVSLTLQQLPELSQFIELALTTKEAISVQQDNEGNLTFSLPSGVSLKLPAQTIIPELTSEQPFIIFDSQSLRIGANNSVLGFVSARISAPLVISPDSNNLLADSLLQSAGLTPSQATREGAAALIDKGLPVNRQNIQTLLAVAAGKSGEDRISILSAGAKLLELEAPVSPVLSKGITVNESGGSPVSSRLVSIIHNLQNASEVIPENLKQGLAEAAKSLQNLSVIVGDTNTAQNLQNFTMQLGREVLFEAAQSLEQATSAIISQSPELKIIDSVLEVMLPYLSNAENTEDAQLPQQTINPAPAETPNAANPAESTINAVLPESESSSKTQIMLLGQNPTAPAPASDATQNTLNISDKSAESSLTDSTIKVDVAVSQAGDTTAGANALANSSTQEITGKQPASLLTPGAVISGSQIEKIIMSEQQNEGNTARQTLTGLSTGVPNGELRLMLRNLLFDASLNIPAHPGVDNFSSTLRELLSQDAFAPVFDRQAAEGALRQIFNADTPQQAMETARTLVNTLDKQTLREVAHTLQLVEKEEISSQPGMRQLREASESLRDLGRSFIAQKAQNISTMRQDPGIVAAHIPLRFGNETGDGNLQMFYRKGRSGSKKNWQQRIMLELNMSALGNVMGDLRFYQGQLNLTLLSENQDTINLLQSCSDELSQNLNEAGFPCSPGFRIIKPKPQKEDADASTISRKNGHLDIKA